MGSWTDFFKSKTPFKRDQYKQIEDLGLKLHADDILKGRIMMIDYLYLATEVGEVDLSDYIDTDAEDKNIQILVKISKLATSKSYKEQVQSLYIQLKFIDRVLRIAAIPWMRAGTDRRAATVLRGWEGLFSVAKANITTIENIFTLQDEGYSIKYQKEQLLIAQETFVEKARQFGIDADDSIIKDLYKFIADTETKQKEDPSLMTSVMDRSEIIHNLKMYLTIVTFKHALYIADISFREEDVSVNQIAILLNVAGQGGGYSFTPGSNYPIQFNIPDNKPYEKRVPE